MVALVDRSREQLGIASGDLEGAEVALELGSDPLLLRGAEAPGRDLLARVDGLDGDQVVDLVRLRDRTRDHAPPRHVLDAQHVALCNVRAGGSERDVVRGDVDGNLLLALLDVSLVVRDVKRRQQGGDDRKRDRDADVAKSICHGGGSLSPSVS